MTSTMDWSQVDNHTNYLNSDLFGGDLFGDELMDMYTSVSDDDPELVGSSEAIVDQVLSRSELKYEEIALKKNEDLDDGFGVSTSYNDFAQLFTSSAEEAPLSVSDSAMATATAFSLSAMPITGKAAEVVTKAAVALLTKRTVKKTTTTGGAKKRQDLEAVNPFARQVSSSSSVSLCAMDKSGQDLSNSVFNVPSNASTISEVEKVAVKRMKTIGIQAIGGANNTASRKAALAEAVAQYAPLAASKISKIRLNAPILEKPLGGKLSKDVFSVANPLDQVYAAQPVVLNNQSTRPTTPISFLRNKEKSSSLVSPGGSEVPSYVVSSFPPFIKGNSVMTPVMPDLTVVEKTPSIVQAVALSELPSVMALKTAESGSNKIITTHVNTLTSLNWPITEAASTAVSCPLNIDASKAAAAQAQKRRASLTVEDRAKQNRDRNREHARNTRLRKKAYVDELKKKLTEIVSQRDSLEVEKMRDTELRSVRFSVVQEFLKVRSSTEGDVKRWSSILDENFVLRLPVTQYRNMVLQNRFDGNTIQFSQELKGISEVIYDASLLAEMLRSFEHIAPSCGSRNSLGLVFDCDRSTFMMDGSSSMLCWTAKTVGCSSQGAAHELAVKGNLRAMFDTSTNKLTLVEMYFDTNAVSLQLQSMYPLSFCDGISRVYEDADETVALLDSLNVPQFEGFSNETSHSISSESSSEL